MSEGSRRVGHQSRLTVVPCGLDQANAYVRRYHRHHDERVGHKFSLALVDDGGLVRGVVIVGRPVARMLQDGWTLEVNRLCTDGCPNACSALYSAAWDAAKALGYRRLVTYILASEPGTSLRALTDRGWRRVLDSAGGSWERVNRGSWDHYPLVAKVRWEVGAAGSMPVVTWPAAEQGIEQLALEAAQ